MTVLFIGTGNEDETRTRRIRENQIQSTTHETLECCSLQWFLMCWPEPATTPCRQLAQQAFRSEWRLHSHQFLKAFIESLRQTAALPGREVTAQTEVLLVKFAACHKPLYPGMSASIRGKQGLWTGTHPQQQLFCLLQVLVKNMSLALRSAGAFSSQRMGISGL